MNFDLANVSDEEIRARITKAEAIDPQEPCRVGMYLGALHEVARLRRILETRDVNEKEIAYMMRVKP